MKIRERITGKRAGAEMARFFLVMAMLVVFAGQVGITFLLMAAGRPGNPNRAGFDQVIAIEPGQPGVAIGKLLEESGIINNSNLFRLALLVTRSESKLQVGEYLLDPAMSVLEVIAKLKGGAVLAHRVVIPEGSNLEQIAQQLTAEGLIDQQRFLQLARDAQLVYGTQVPLDLPIGSLEGYLFPDTYQFVKGQTEEAIIGQMVTRFISYVVPQVDLSKLDNKYSLHQIITLASIVEKEVMVDRERPIVAGVYLNRLAINMRLQADPTVRYVMTEDRSRVLYSDLEIDSPYNTYRYDGLPPGPIASPGIRSILAVLEPEKTDYFYFISKGDGTHQFSTTFNEHVAARKMLGY